MGTAGQFYRVTPASIFLTTMSWSQICIVLISLSFFDTYEITIIYLAVWLCDTFLHIVMPTNSAYTLFLQLWLFNFAFLWSPVLSLFLSKHTHHHSLCRCLWLSSASQKQCCLSISATRWVTWWPTNSNLMCVCDVLVRRECEHLNILPLLYFPYNHYLYLLIITLFSKIGIVMYMP